MRRALLLVIALGAIVAACRAPVGGVVKATPAPADTTGTGFVRHDTTMIDSPIPSSRR